MLMLAIKWMNEWMNNNNNTYTDDVDVDIDVDDDGRHVIELTPSLQ